MAFETVSIKNAAGDSVPVVVDKIGDDYVQVQKLGYGADGAIVGLDEKPATAAKQDTANEALGAPADAEAASGNGSIVALLKALRTVLGAIDTALGATLGVAGTVDVGNFPASFQVSNFPATQPVSAAALPLPAGASTETTLAALSAKIPASPATEGGNLATLVARAAALISTVPPNDAAAPPMRAVGQDIWNCSFSNVGASVLAAEMELMVAGAGVGYSQAAGALAITTGTGANAEFLARSTRAWQGALRAKASTVLSQRIANQNFMVLLGDLVGADLAVTVNSATSISVTKTGHGLTAQNVGQFMFVGGIAGISGAVPGRYAIASIPNADTINFTVAGWPGSGSGSLDLFGHSHAKILYNGTTATAAGFSTQRRGWADADTTLTINTTASPGHIAHLELTGRECFALDQLRASTTTPAATLRGSRIENVPDDNLDLHLFVWSYNGSTAPATTTTWTISFLSVEKFANTPVYVQGMRAQGAANPLPVAAQGTTPVSMATNTPTLAAGTNLAGDVGLQVRANATGAATPTNYVSPATPAGATIKGGAGRNFGFFLVNLSAGMRYVKVFNATSVTMGTTSAAYEFPIPAGGIAPLHIPVGLAHSTGIMVAVTAARGLTDNTATGLALGDVVGFFASA